MALLLPLLAGVAAMSAGTAATVDVSTFVQRPSAAAGDVAALVQRSLQSRLAAEDASEDIEGDQEESLMVADEGEDEVNDEASSEDDFVAGKTIDNYTVSDSIMPSDIGPMAYTDLGPVMGTDKGDHYFFPGLRYAETPERFEVPRQKTPWAPRVYRATKFRAACMGASTNEHESEDCLHLNIWVPKGGLKDMPVIVYVHGGINQHGSGSEPSRRGDVITTSSKYPTIFINFNWRLGIFGWINLNGSSIPRNLGLLDQQTALRWVQENIGSFGGDPTRVTLQGQSEGCGAILVHMVAPGSAGLFQRAVWHSAVADVWSRNTNRDRTDFVVEKANCVRPNISSTLRCLKRKHSRFLWNQDWNSEELSRNVGLPSFNMNAKRLLEFGLESKHKTEIPGMLGWHAEVDNVTLLGEPVELIRQGRFHKVTLLMTVSPNETLGVLPPSAALVTGLGLQYFLGDRKQAVGLYARTLEVSGIVLTDPVQVTYQILTDKLWTCDIRSLAADVTRGGGRAYVGMFAHAPRFSISGVATNLACALGATCHADEMPYVLPQGKRGIRGPGMEGELAFSKKYSESFLAFVHGDDKGHPWVPYDVERQPITFYKASGATVVPMYRKEQCDVLDRFNGPLLPRHMRDRTVR